MEDAGSAGLPLVDDLGRAVRGAGYGRDVAQCLESGSRLLVFEDRAAVCVREGYVQLLVARDEEAAALALWAALVSAPPGMTALVLFMTAAQQWAIRVALDARLPLSPDGPVCVKGKLGPLRRSFRAGPISRASRRRARDRLRRRFAPPALSRAIVRSSSPSFAQRGSIGGARARGRGPC